MYSPEERNVAALMSLVTGKLVEDIPVAEFGEFGKALLEMARLEAGVLGNGLDGGAFYSL